MRRRWLSTRSRSSRSWSRGRRIRSTPSWWAIPPAASERSRATCLWSGATRRWTRSGRHLSTSAEVAARSWRWWAIPGWGRPDCSASSEARLRISHRCSRAASSTSPRSPTCRSVGYFGSCSVTRPEPTRAPSPAGWEGMVASEPQTRAPLTPEVRALSDEFRRAKLDEVMSDYLSKVVTDPTLVVIEDAHWMDEGSVSLLRHIAGRIGDMPWLICVSRRDEATGYVGIEAARCSLLPLAPLSGESLDELIGVGSEEGPFPPHGGAELTGRWGGTPLFLLELLQAARGAGSVSALPDSIEGMVTAEIDRLPIRDRRIIRYASVLGVAFDARQVQALSDEKDAVDGGVGG